MLQMICSCGEILGNKEILYEERMSNACNIIGMDFNALSLGDVDLNDEYKKLRQDVINDLCRRYCCKQNMMNYLDLVLMIK